MVARFVLIGVFRPRPSRGIASLSSAVRSCCRFAGGAHGERSYRFGTIDAVYREEELGPNGQRLGFGDAFSQGTDGTVYDLADSSHHRWHPPRDDALDLIRNSLQAFDGPR